MNDAKEEIRARLAVEDVVGQYIELKRAGRNLKGRSPWGVDKTPSLMVSPDKGIWHDFSANKGGDIFSFVMEMEGIDFKEALEKLARQAGVELEKYRGGDEKIAKKKMEMRRCLDLAAKFYQVCLTKNREAINYVFYKRRMNRGTVEKFRIGYAPSSGKVLVEFLKRKGFSEEMIRDAGLMNQYGGDLFRGRMMVPFMDMEGQVIGFTGRIIGEGEPKYLNTPETLLFNKGRFIFGLNLAKMAIRKKDRVVLVEGNMDVISSHQAGVDEAVATSGTAMTEMQLKMLSRMTSDLRLAYDGDGAGIAAAERAVWLAGDRGLSLLVVNFGEAKDPDELIKKDARLWQRAVEEAQPAIDWLLKKYEEKVDLTTGEGKRVYSDVAMKLIEKISDRVEQAHYEKKVAEILDVSVEDLLAKKFKKVNQRRKKETKVGEKGEALQAIEDSLLAIILMMPELRMGVKMELPEEAMKLEELKLIFEIKYGKWEKEQLRRELEELEKRRVEELRKKKVEELGKKLAEAEGDDAETERILREVRKVNKESLRLKK